MSDWSEYQFFVRGLAKARAEWKLVVLRTTSEVRNAIDQA
jgi:hypothetical protein